VCLARIADATEGVGRLDVSWPLSEGCAFKDAAATVIVTNPIIPNGNPFQNMELDFGTNPTVSFAA
jgi:hypothetical protein